MTEQNSDGESVSEAQSGALDSTRVVQDRQASSRIAVRGQRNRLFTRRVLVPLLVLPITLIFSLIIAGFLYITYQDIISSLADEEYHRTEITADALRDEFSLIRHDLLSLLLGQSLSESTRGLPEALERDADNFLNVIRTRSQYEFIALVDAGGREVLRVERSATGPRRVPQSGLQDHADREYLESALSALDAQDIGVSIVFPSGQPGSADDAVLIYYSVPIRGETQGEYTGALLLAYRPDSAAETIVALAEESAGLIWFLTLEGQYLMGSPDSTAMSVNDPRAGLPSLAQVHPELWALIQANEAPPITIESGIFSYFELCAQLNCQNDSAASFSDGEGRGFLVSYLPGERLAPMTILADRTERWSQLTLLLFLGALLAVAAAWLLAAILVRLRRNEQRLQRANLLQEAFFEKNPEIMFVKNLDGSFNLANEKCRELTGQTEVDFKDMKRENVFPADAAAGMEQQDIQVIQSEQAMEFQSRWKREDGVYHYKTLRFPMYDEKGDLIALGGIANDVTDQVQSRHALIENERLLRTFIESAPDAVLITDSTGGITLVNKAAEHVFGYDRSEMLRLNLFSLIRELKRQDFSRVLSGRDEKGGEVLRESLDGTGIGQSNRNFPVEFSLAPIRTDDGALMICVLRDVSEKALMETQLRQSQKMEAIGKLTGGMAHDFNNLLGIIIGNLALARRHVKDDERTDKRLETALKASERGAELTKRMLAVARRQPLQPKPISVNSIVEEIAQMLPQSLGSDIEVELNLQKDLPPILVDVSSFESMLLNLAINSRDAMRAGGKFTIETSLEDRSAILSSLPHTIVRGERYVHIAVEDTGEGMSEEALSRAFEPFFTTKAKGKGTGLGLAMIYGFVKQSHGFITIQSEPGSGTRINIFLPVDEGTELEEEDLFFGEDSPHLEMDSRTVLVVDDEVDLLDIARAYLEELKLTVHTAASGAEALEVLTENTDIDLMITDVVMPGGINGPTLAKEVRKQWPEVAILYASGFPSGDIQEASGAVLDAPLIHKPYTREILTAHVIETLARQESEV